MKQWIKPVLLLGYIIAFIACNDIETNDSDELETDDIRLVDTMLNQPAQPFVTAKLDSSLINTNNHSPDNIVAYAKTLIGVPYKYGSTDPLQGFDCSGFITYVFNNFNIAVPRSSIDFTNVGIPVNRELATTGDLILFTGTDTLETHVGHMGIVTENTDSLRFIHSTSGKKYGVTITALNDYYQKRFVKVIRIF